MKHKHGHNPFKNENITETNNEEIKENDAPEVSADETEASVDNSDFDKLKEDFEFLKYFSPFDYYAPSEILKDGFEVKFIIIGICVIIISIISSYFIYSKKDMNI